MSFTAEKLYRLLPPIYRSRDAEQGETLKALLVATAEQVAVLEEDLAQLYDDQFIETCAEWVVPYIGDLLGVRLPYAVSAPTYSPRAYVANTITYRRRKGTATILEQLARDMTGWPARAVEFFQRLSTTQHLNHPRLEALATVDLRRWEPLERLDTAFDSLSHTIAVRPVSQGRYNIPNIGIFLWRLGAYSLARSPAFRIDNRRYLFSPLGDNTPLYTKPVPENEITHIAEPLNVPMPISRRMLDLYLKDYYGRDKSILIEKNGKEVPISQIVVCDLSDWQSGQWAHEPPAGKIALDPLLGRMAFAEDLAQIPLVSFHYGFSTNMGGGEYGRADSFDEQPDQTLVKVPDEHPTVQAALSALAVSGGVVEITDSSRYREASLTIAVPAGKRLVLRAANGHRPTLEFSQGNIQIKAAKDAEVTLNGLLISGSGLQLGGGDPEYFPGRLRLQHCTLVPGLGLNSRNAPLQPDQPSLTFVANPNGKVTIEIDHSIVGPLHLPAEQVELQIRDSIVDSPKWSTPPAIPAIAGSADGNQPGPPVVLQRSTVLGTVHVRELVLASEVIFVDPVVADRRQSGCVRFSYVPAGPAGEYRISRHYHCQPVPGGTVQLEPIFSSIYYGDPGYCQLSMRCPPEIRQGAEDGAEMGAFHDLYQPQRETNLRAVLNEYLRFGLEAAIFYEN